MSAVEFLHGDIAGTQVINSNYLVMSSTDVPPSFFRNLCPLFVCAMFNLGYIIVVFVLTFIYSADTKGCKISVDAATSLGKPQYNNQPRQPTYSCTPGSSSSSQYEVHVLSVYEVINRRPPTAADATVNIFSGGRSDRPLVLVLASYEPLNWILKLPSDVTISRVILVRTQKRQLYDK